MKDSTKLGIAVVIILILVGQMMGYYDLFAIVGYKPVAKPTPTPGGNVYPVKQMFQCMNGTALEGATVEVYIESKDIADYWELKASGTTSTSDPKGQFDSGSIQFAEGDTVMFHVVTGTYDGKKIPSQWYTRTVPARSPELTYIGFKDPIKVYVTPSASSKLDIKLFDKQYTAIGETDAAATSLSKSAGAADFSGEIRLIITAETYVAFGLDSQQPKTDQGHKLRHYQAIVYVEFNRTDISWKQDGWTLVSGTSATVKRYARTVDILVCADTQPVSASIPIAFDATQLADNTAFKATIYWEDFQLFTETVGSVTVSTVGVNPGYNYAINQYFVMKAVA